VKRFTPYNIFSETVRVAYGDLCYFRRNIVQVTISSIIGPLLYLLAFGYGMRSGSTGAADVSYIAYVIPGIIAITTLTAGFASSSQKILIQRLFYTSFDELILCPMHTPSIILGKSVIGMLKGLVGSACMLVLGLFLTPDIFLTPGFIGCIVLSCFVYSLMGVMAGLLANSSPTLNMLGAILITPMTFLCGTLFSVSSLPEAVAYVIWCLPLTHSSEIIRASALGWAFPWWSLITLVVFAIGFFIIDCKLIKEKLY
jgi:ABC-2 type transport system permease protein